MALIKCPECGNQVSDKAASCPNCGCPVSDTTVQPNPSPYTQPQVNAGKTGQFLITKEGSPSSFRLFSVDDTHVNLECRGCGKVYKLKRKNFEYVGEDKCIASIRLDCPNCGGKLYNGASYNEAKAATQFHSQVKNQPQVKETKPMSFWSVVWAIIVAVIILAFC